MAYLNVDEIEGVVQTLAAAHPGVTELILLRNRISAIRDLALRLDINQCAENINFAPRSSELPISLSRPSLHSQSTRPKRRAVGVQCQRMVA
jgi:hypothetical protein